MTLLSLKIDKVIENNPTFRTYVFKHGTNAKPGQFYMVWLPGVDEIPISVGWQTDDEFRLGIAKVGGCTEAIFKQIKAGGRLGLRGPFGKPFDLKGYKKIMLVGGGTGTPPMLNLAQRAKEKNIKTTVVLGARTKGLLLYEKEFKSLGCDLHVATDDGSKGCKGYCTNIVEEKIKSHKIDCIYTCGPELMMYRIAEMAKINKVDCQVSLERFMKCGFGICGQCCIDGTGLRVCKDGPVFDGKIALQHQEFGKYKRTSSGIRVDL